MWQRARQGLPCSSICKDARIGSRWASMIWWRLSEAFGPTRKISDHSAPNHLGAENIDPRGHLVC